MFPRARDGDYGGFNDEQGNKSVMATSLFPRDGTKLLAEEALRPYPELLQGFCNAADF